MGRRGGGGYSTNLFPNAAHRCMCRSKRYGFAPFWPEKLSGMGLILYPDLQYKTECDLRTRLEWGMVLEGTTRVNERIQIKRKESVICKIQNGFLEIFLSVGVLI